MQQLTGSLLVITATTAAGILYGLQLQSYLETLYYIRQIVYMLKGELEYASAPLSEVFGRLSVRLADPYRKWFDTMREQIEGRTRERFSDIWAQSMEKCLGELHLKGNHFLQLKELGGCLGVMDGKSEGEALALYLNRLETEIENVQKEIAAKKRLGNCLGIMGGIFLVVILI